MLVLSRKSGESIQIGDDVEVTVLAVHRGRIVLGVKAPTSIVVRRLEAIRREPPHSSSAEQFRSERRAG